MTTVEKSIVLGRIEPEVAGLLHRIPAITDGMPTLDQLLPLLAAEPDDTFLRYAVAMEYAKQARPDEALAEFRELLKRHSDYVPGHFMAGRAAEQKGDSELAKAFYKSGIAAAEKTGDTHAAGEISSALMMLE